MCAYVLYLVVVGDVRALSSFPPRVVNILMAFYLLLLVNLPVPVLVVVSDSVLAAVGTFNPYAVLSIERRRLSNRLFLHRRNNTTFCPQ